MGLDRSRHTDRKAILREVYEENKRIRDRTLRQRVYASRPYVTGIGGVVMLVAMLALVANFVFQEDATVSDRNSAAGRTGMNDGPNRSVSALSDEPLDAKGDIPDARAYGAIGSGSVPLATLFDLSVRTIVIDPGHGGRDPGSIGSAGLYEKEITLDVAQRLKRRLLNGYGYRIELTRDTDSTLSLRQRAEFSNRHEADLFVSIHVNYFPEEPVYALETYYYGPRSNRSSVRLAEIENRFSDYAVAEFNAMSRRLGDRIKLQESRRLALYVQRSLFRHSRELNEEVSNWGVKSAPFIVLVGVTAPGILAEIGVISNRDEEARLQTPEYREQLAMFLEEGIVNYLNEHSQQEASINGVTQYAPKEAEND